MNHKTIAKFVTLVLIVSIIIVGGITVRLSAAVFPADPTPPPYWCIPEVEPNDTAETAQEVPLPGCVDGTVDEADWYTVQVVKDEFAILLQAPESQRVRLVVYGPEGKIFDWEDWGDLAVGFHNHPTGKYDVGLIWLGNETPTPEPTYTPPVAGVAAIGDSYRITFGPDDATATFFTFLPAVFRGSSPVVELTHTPPAKVNYSRPRDDYDYRVFLPLVFRPRSTILTVCPAGPPTCGYATVQEAVDAAEDGDVIKVAAGTYTGVNDYGGLAQVVYVSKTVTIRGGYATTDWATPDPEANPTTLDAQGQGRVLYITGNISPTIEGLRITGGDAAGLGGASWVPEEDAGGGIYVITATTTSIDNQIFGNTARGGGGMYVANAATNIIDNEVFGNIVSGRGAGGGIWMYASKVILNGNSFASNTALTGSDGGGVAVHYGEVTFNENTFTDNSASRGGGVRIFITDDGSVKFSGNTFVSNTASSRGGGVAIWQFPDHDKMVTMRGGNVTFENNTVISNTAQWGGGLYLSSMDGVTLDGNLIVSNTADYDGGGLFLYISDDVTLVNNVVADNRANRAGSGLHFECSSSRLLHTTITHNDGDGICVTGCYGYGSAIALTNTIISGHTVGITVTAGNTATLESTLWWSNTTDWGGAGAISANNDHTGDPLFFASDGYHLTINSAAIDKGVDAGVYTDIDGDVRPAYGLSVGYDLGADETPTPEPTYMPLAAGVAAIGDSYRITFGPDDATFPQPTYTLPVQVNDGRPRDGDDYDYRVFLPLVFRPRSTVLTVCPAGPPTCGYAIVQEAVDAAEDGNVIKVAAGTYTDVSVRPRNDRVTTGVVTQVVYISKTVTIRGGYTTTDWTTPDPEANPTTLDAQGRGRVLYVTGDISPTIEGLRITGGDAAGLGGGLGDEDAGGGLYVIAAAAMFSNNQVFGNAAEWYGGGVCLVSSEATLVGNTVVSNTAHFGGGGLFLKDSDAALSDNIISANTASIEGGGLYLYLSDAILSGNTITGNTSVLGGGLLLEGGDSTLSDNTISANTAHHGGGLYLVGSDAVLSDNTITTNTATFTDNPNCDGGGLYLSSSDVIFNRNTISANTAQDGGGLLLSWSDAVFNGDIVSDNTADLDGGGLYLAASAATLINTVVADNQANAEGGGLYVTSSSPRLLHTTIARNGSDGVYVTDYYWIHSTIALTNSIIASHTVGIAVTAGNTATLESTLWWGNTTDWGGAGTVVHVNDYTGDPLFAPDGYHLKTGFSAAIDEGEDAGVGTDIDGEIRPAKEGGVATNYGLGSGFDLGADEYQW